MDTEVKVIRMFQGMSTIQILDYHLQLTLFMVIQNMSLHILNLVYSLFAISVPPGTLISSALPNIIGEAPNAINKYDDTVYSGALYGTGGDYNIVVGKGSLHPNTTLYLDASICSSVYTTTDKVITDSIAVSFFIRY